MYDYLVYYMNKVMEHNATFFRYYQNRSPEYALIYQAICKIVTLFYEYNHQILTIRGLVDILEQIRDLSKTSIISDFNIKIQEIINAETIEFTNKEQLILKKQKSMNDIFHRVSKLISNIPDIEKYITLIQQDILQTINNVNSLAVPDASGTNTTEVEINSNSTAILNFIYTKNFLYHAKYLHHLRNIYLGIRFYLQPGYMNKFKHLVNQNKYYCCIKHSGIVLQGMIINRYYDRSVDKYLQEHIFISSNFKTLFNAGIGGKRLSLYLHSYASNLQPYSDKIYCNPMPSMLKILKDASRDSLISLHILSKAEQDEIAEKKILCFKFVPSISIDVAPFLFNYWKKRCE